MNRDQLRAVIWLRWRLLQNQWARGLGALVALLVAVSGACLGVVSFVGALVAGAFALDSLTPLGLSFVWLGVTAAFSFFWATGLLSELQRSESIDLQRLMHLPAELGQLFVLNYLVSHLTVSIVLFVPGMLGLALGLAWSRGPAMLLLVPLALGVVAMITAWTYCLRGWLAAMMNDPRRRRAIVMGITLLFIVVAQLPNLYFNVFEERPTGVEEVVPLDDATPPRLDDTPEDEVFTTRLLLAQQVIPPLWLPAGAHALAEGRPWPAVLYAAGCFAIAGAGLGRAYRSSLRAYRGEGGSARSAAPSSAPRSTGVGFLEARLPGVPEQAAAIALGTLRSTLRAPEVKMAWAASYFITLLLGASVIGRGPTIPEVARPFVVVSVGAWSMFMLIQFLANQFGFDRDGFRALVLSPVDRRLILLGKNLASLPIMLAFGLSLVLATAIALRLPPLAIGAALLQLAALQLQVALAGNALSILTPYRIEAGSMKPTKMPVGAMLVAVMVQVVFFPLVMLPAYVPALAELAWRQTGGSPDVPVSLGLSALLCGAAACLYAWSLGPLGRLLQRRETQILAAVTRATE